MGLKPGCLTLTVQQATTHRLWLVGKQALTRMFCNVWMCVCVDLIICGCSGNTCTCTQ